MTQDPHSEVSLSGRDPNLFLAVFRYKLTILLVWLVASGTAYWSARMIPARFSANATLLIKFGREFLYRSEVGSESTNLYKLPEMVNTEIEIFKSFDLARRVAAELGPLELYPDLVEPGEVVAPEKLVDKAAGRIKGDLSVGATTESSIINVSFQHDVRKTAVQVVNLLIQHFLDKHLEVFGDHKSTFLAEQCANLKSNLEKADAGLENLRKQTGTFDMLKQSDQLLSQQLILANTLQELELRLSELPESDAALPPGFLSTGSIEDQKLALGKQREQILVAQGEADLSIGGLEKELSLLDELVKSGDIAAHPRTENKYLTLDQMQQKLLDLRLRESEALKVYAAGSDTVAGIRREAQEVQSFIKEKEASIARVIRSRIAGEIEVLRNRNSELGNQLRQITKEAQLLDLYAVRDERGHLETRKAAILRARAELDERLSTMASAKTEFERLDRTRSMDEETFRIYSKKLEEARIAEDLNRQKIVNVHVIDKASEPLKSTAPSQKTKLVLSAMVGLIAGLGMGLLRALISS